MVSSSRRADRVSILRFVVVVSAVIISTTALESEEVLTPEEENVDQHNMKVGENRLAAQIFELLDHYKQEDPVGIPTAPIEDPMDVPDMTKSMGLATLRMKAIKSYGLSKFRIKSVKADLKEMKVEGMIQLDEMLTEGLYTLNSFMSKSEGPFHVSLKNVTVTAEANLLVQMDGQLSTDAIVMDITFKDMAMEFKNLGFLGSVFQSIMNSAPNLVFDGMKPFMLKEADMKMREEIDGTIKKLMGDRRLPNSISPLDMAIAEGRKKVREMGYDPYHIPSYNKTVGIFSISTTNTYITGGSSFYRVGDIVLSMENNTVSSKFLVGTQKIHGSTQWEVGMGVGLVSRIGHAQFSVEHIKVGIDVSQSLDTRKHPLINDLQIKLGNIQVRMDGAGTIDYIMEFLVNVLPNILRYQITDAIENPLKTRIQEKFNQINVEEAIKKNFHKFEAMASGKGAPDFEFDFKF